MTTTSSTYAPPVPVTGWRERIKITRLGFFAVFFIVLGAWVLISAPRNIAPDVTTLLTVDATGIQGITVPTLSFSIVAALLYVAGGIFALLPVPALKRFKFWWLLVNGLLLIPLMLIIIAAG